jgi:hypothetical protein
LPRFPAESPYDYNNLLTAIIANICLAQTYLNRDAKPFRLLSHALVASEAAHNLTLRLITFFKGGSPIKKIAAVDCQVESAVEFTLRLKAIDPNVKGIVSSGYSDGPGMTGFKEYGFCGVVAKPNSLEDLGEKLGAVLNG